MNYFADIIQNWQWNVPSLKLPKNVLLLWQMKNRLCFTRQPFVLSFFILLRQKLSEFVSSIHILAGRAYQTFAWTCSHPASFSHASPNSMYTYIRFFYLSLVNTSLVNSAKQHTTSLKLCCDFRKCFALQRMSVWNSVRSRSSHNGWMLICETWNMHYKSTLPPKKSIHMQEQSVVEYIARHILSLVLFI